MLKVKKLQNGAKSDIGSLIRDYTKFAGANSHTKAEKVYEEIIGYCVAYKGKDSEGVARILEGIVANQQNRTMISMQLRSRSIAMSGLSWARSSRLLCRLFSCSMQAMVLCFNFLLLS